jgi:hypothetical protein
LALSVAVALTALVVAAPAVAATRVTVRVEGPVRTIFGAAQPLVPFVGSLPADGGQTVELAGPTALGALEAAADEGGFAYRLRVQSFGAYVDRVAGKTASGASGWVFKVNGVSSPVGAAEAALEQGDDVLWYYATFGEQGGPQTLDIRVARGGCLVAEALDDAGKRTRATAVVFRIDDKAVRSASGRVCPATWSTARVTKAGLVRSQELTAG